MDKLIHKIRPETDNGLMMRGFLEKKTERRKVALHDLFTEASRDFEKICTYIINEYQPEKIYQWGSLLNENLFSEISDIDIALQGTLSPEVFFKIIYESQQMSQFPVDIVQLETIMPVHREKIITHGKLVYERAS